MLTNISSFILTTNLSSILVGGSVLLLGGVGVTYGFLLLNKNKSKNNKKNNFKITNKIDDLNNKKNEPILNKKKESNPFDNLESMNSLNIVSLSKDVTSSELIDSAILFDSYGNREDVLNLLKEAISKETNNKELTRLKFLLKKYSSGEEKLKELTKKYPTFLKNENPINFAENKKVENFDIFNNKYDNIENLNINHDKISPDLNDNEKHLNISSSVIEEELNAIKIASNEINTTDNNNNDELIFKDLIVKAQKEDELKKDDIEYSENLFSEFQELANQIKNDTSKEVNKLNGSSAYKIWVNYMMTSSNKMEVKNKLVNLNNPWGTTEAIDELQTIIAEESFYLNGKKDAYGIISVIPVNS